MKKFLLTLVLLFTIKATVINTTAQTFFGVYSPTTAIFSGMDSITSGSVSAASQMDIVFTGQYNVYKYFFLLISVSPGTDNTNLQMLVSADGSTYDNAAGNYNWNLNYGGGSSAGQPDVVIQLIGNCGNTSGYHNDGWIMFQSPSNTSQRPLFEYHLSETDQGGTNAPINGVATRKALQATKSIRIKYSSGTITGSYKLLASY